jgi:hypothetical protein
MQDALERLGFRGLRLVAAALLGAALPACAANVDDGEEASAVVDVEPVVWAATTSAVRARCAPELATRYCSMASAEAGAARCLARLTSAELARCDREGCLVPFTPVREGACVEGPTYPDAEACHHPVADDCSFYRSCVETAHPCGDDGYALGFGERFCNVFMEHDDAFTPKGRTWLRSVRRCLQTELVDALDAPMACSALSDRAYGSHAGCYTLSGNSICDLPARDVAKLTELVAKDPGQQAFKQMKAVIRACTIAKLDSK